jgi:hypothetical protein
VIASTSIGTTSEELVAVDMVDAWGVDAVWRGAVIGSRARPRTRAFSTGVLGTFTISEFALVKVIINLDGENHVVVERRGFRANEHNGISNGRLKALLELVKLRLVREADMGQERTEFRGI